MKNIKIISPSKELFELYDNTKNEIQRVIPDAKIELVGALAVPMAGKEEIDIMVICNDIESVQKTLEKYGFMPGQIVKGEAFSHKKVGNIVLEIHIMRQGHKNIELYQNIRSRLKEDKELRDKYEKLKISLDGKSEKEYKKAKSDFIREHRLA